MRALVGLLALAACGGGATLVPPAAPPSPHGSRHLVVREAFAALAGGRAEALTALAGTDAIFEAALVCESTSKRHERTERIRANIEAAIENARGTTIEVLAIERLARVEAGSFPAGGRTGDCDVKRAIEGHVATVALRIREPGKPPRETRTLVGLTEIEGRWYLAKLPKRLVNELDDALSKVEGFSSRMCACKDKACADAVNDDYTKWGTEMAKHARRDDGHDKPDPKVIERMTEAATRYAECYTKLAMAAAGSTP